MKISNPILKDYLICPLKVIVFPARMSFLSPTCRAPRPLELIEGYKYATPNGTTHRNQIYGKGKTGEREGSVLDWTIKLTCTVV
jgi:hypothetical protein